MFSARTSQRQSPSAIILMFLSSAIYFTVTHMRSPSTRAEAQRGVHRVDIQHLLREHRLLDDELHCIPILRNSTLVGSVTVKSLCAISPHDESMIPKTTPLGTLWG